MKKWLIFGVLGLTCIILFAGNNKVMAADYVPGEVVVTYDNQQIAKATSTKINNDAADDVEIKSTTTIGSMTIGVAASTEKSTKEMVAYMKEQPGVTSVEPNYYLYAQSASLPTDSYYGSQWGLINYGQDGGSSGNDIGADYLWINGYTGANKVIAVIDSGVDYTHEDLVNRLWHNTTSLSGLYGYDFANNDNDPFDDEASGHGTHVTGIIAAQGDNSTGITGVCQKAKIMSLKILDKNGVGTLARAVAAYKYIYSAMKKGVAVVAINNSWGSTGVSSTLNTLVKKVGALGAVSVFASGNDGKYIARDTLPVYSSNPYAITVAACDSYDKLTNFSNYGATAVNIAAPGKHILSTINNYKFMPVIYSPTQLLELCDTYDFFFNNSWINRFAVKENNISTKIEWDSTKEIPVSQTYKGVLKITASNTSMQDGTVGLYYQHDEIKASYFAAFTVAYDDISNWTTACFNTNKYEKLNNASHLAICSLKVPANTTRTFYIDNWAISQPNPTQSSFGKYDYMDGTSMAAPFVTGSVALLAQYAKTFTAAELKQMLLKCVRKSSSLTGKVSTGGCLDLSKYYAAYQSVLKSRTVDVKKLRVTYYKKVRAGKKYKIKVKVVPTNATNKKVKFKVNNKKYASITSKGIFKAKKKGRGKTVKLTIWSASNKSLKRTFKIKILK